MKDIKLEGFLGIPFYSTQIIAKEKISERNGILDSENSDNEYLFYNKLSFAGHETELILLSFLDDQFAKASIFIKPKLESRVIDVYKKICNDLNEKYYLTNKNYESYDFPYEKNDGYTETAISLGKAEFSCFWNFINPGKEDDYISVAITENLEILIIYEHGHLNNLLVSRNEQKNSLDY